MKKIISVVLSVCMVVMMGVPAFASSSSDIMKTQLSDEAMASAVGGWGRVNAVIESNSNGRIVGYIENPINTAGNPLDYTITCGINANGTGGYIVQQGVVDPDTAILFDVPCQLYAYCHVDAVMQNLAVMKATSSAACR